MKCLFVSSNLFVILSLCLLIIGATGCPDNKAPGPVTLFTATPGNGQVALSWVNPGDGDFAGTVVVRKIGSPPGSPSDGTLVYDGTGQSVTDTGLTNGETYYYAAFAHDGRPNYSAGATATALPTGSTTVAEVLDEYDNLGDAVDDSGLPEGDKQALREALAEAESEYRGGDACGAADSLIEFAQLAQGARAGDAAPSAEDLFNQGRMLRFNMLLLAANKNDCEGGDRVGLPAETADEASDDTKLDAQTAFGEPLLMTVVDSGETFTQLVIPGAETEGGELGEPAVPVYHCFFAVPEGATAAVNVQKTAILTAETIQMNLAPVQEEPIDSPDYVAGPFVKDAAAYKANAPYPPQPVSISPVGKYRDLNVFAMHVAAGQYNPATQTMTLFERIDPVIDFTGGTGRFIPDRALSPFEPAASDYVGGMVNSASVIEGVEVVIPVVEDLLGEELIILSPPLLKDAADALEDWKELRGIPTHVFTVCDGDGDGPDTIDEIRQLIRDEYDYGTIRPSYVLIFGDVNLIPTAYVTPKQAVGAPTIATDFVYANYQSETTDLYPEFAVGRIPAKTLAEAFVIVDKIITYESEPPTDFDFYRNAAIAAEFQCCRDDVTQDGTAQRTFSEVSEWCNNVMTSRGKVVDRLYRETVDYVYSPRDTTPRRWFDGALIPSAIGPGNGFSWATVSTADISAAINDGRFLVIHRDHGSPSSWITPSFGNASVDALTNGEFLPVVFSVNCASGLFDSETANGAMGTTAANRYLCERFLLNPNGGAVGVFCDSRNSPSWANSALLRGFFDAIWPTAIGTFGGSSSKTRLGDILNHGKRYLITQSGQFEIDSNKITDEIMMWHVLGDPTTEIYTGYPHEITIGASATARLVDNARLQIIHDTEGATITAFRQVDLGLAPVGRGTVEGGAAVLTTIPGLEPSNGSELILVATLPNGIATQIPVTVQDLTPPPDVTGLTAGYSAGGVMVSWTNPVTRDLAGVRVQYRTDEYPTGPQDGQNMFDGSGSSAWMPTSPVALFTYYFTVFTYDATDNYSDGVNAQYTPETGAK